MAETGENASQPEKKVSSIYRKQDSVDFKSANESAEDETSAVTTKSINGSKPFMAVESISKKSTNAAETIKRKEAEKGVKNYTAFSREARRENEVITNRFSKAVPERESATGHKANSDGKTPGENGVANRFSRAVPEKESAAGHKTNSDGKNPEGKGVANQRGQSFLHGEEREDGRSFTKRNDKLGGKKSFVPLKKDYAARDFQNPALTEADIAEIESLQQNLTNFKISETPGSSPGDVAAYKNIKWENLKIRMDLIDVLRRVGFNHPSPAQALSIPAAIEGRDMLVRAKNGSGKSASFIIPILNKIDTSKGLQAIILVPIRELALQIAKVIMTLGKDLNIKHAPLVGGTNLADDIMRITSGTHIIIGTPGRVFDLLSKNLCTIESGLTIVFDEADKLLDCHFYSSVHDLLKIVPKVRQIMLFSATFPEMIEGFVNQYLDSPLKIKISEQNLQHIKQYFVKVAGHTKLPCLKSLLNVLDINQCIMYCNSIKNVKRLAQKITDLEISAYFIHSQMDQAERNIVYHNFSKQKCKILVSTDITTRGIDVPGVNVVVNFDMPLSSTSYLHRIGRAGRFGRKGCAINFISGEENGLVETYERALGVEIVPISDSTFKEFCKQ